MEETVVNALDQRGPTELPKVFSVCAVPEPPRSHVSTEDSTCAWCDRTELSFKFSLLLTHI